MSAPLLWILVPGVFAAVIYFIRGWRKVSIITALLLTLAFAALAWALPIGEPLKIGPLVVEFQPVFNILGRRFEIASADRPILILIYMGLAFWYIGAIFAQVGSIFFPVGLAMAALFTAALVVEPFLYAALLIETACLLSIMILSPPGKQINRGAVSFLTFQTLGMPCILFTGWLLTGVESAPANRELEFQVAILLGLGFAFILGVFPFHNWIQMLGEEAHPFSVAFVFYLLPTIALIFGLGFLEQFAWLRTSGWMYTGLSIAGMLMVITGGFGAALQRNLGRILGSAVMVETGLSLLSLSVGFNEVDGLPLLGSFFALILPRGLSLGLWALALAAIQLKTGSFKFRFIQGTFWRLPVATVALLLAQFSAAGLPLLAGFPSRLALWQGLAQYSSLALIAALLGSFGIMVGGLRAMAVMVTGKEKQDQPASESRGQQILLVIGSAMLLVIGLLPSGFFIQLMRMRLMFPHLSP